MINKTYKKIISLIVILFIFANITFPVLAIDEPSVTSELTPTPTETVQNTTENQTNQTDNSRSVKNTNNAQVDNNTQSSANTGDNSINITPTPAQSISDSDISPTPTITQTEGTELTVPDSVSTPSSELDQTQKDTQSENSTDPTVPSDTSSSTIPPTPAVKETVVNNNNTANVSNDLNSLSQTGNNQTDSNTLSLQTGDASVSANLANVLNTNFTGNNFWQTIINLFSTSENDINLGSLDTSTYSSDLILALKDNANTKDGYINSSLVDLISKFSVYNSNTAVLTNNVNIAADSGDNTASASSSNIYTGSAHGIDTGDANSSLDLFNMVNTNLTGNNFFFGIINLFDRFRGDIVLPYELQFLMDENASQVNGSFDQNLISSIKNSNDALVKNNINVDSNTGRNQIAGNGNIQTGDANSSLNLTNIINTNIAGDRWLFLLVNNFGNWKGTISGWWGNIFLSEKYSLAWIKLPAESTDQAKIEESSSSTTLETTIENNNKAVVENNVQVSANTGNNSSSGGSSDIKTGNAKGQANIFNFVNTNITGSNWFFGIINIFDDFIGDIIFPRPDLLDQNTVDKSSVRRGEEITYTIQYINQGKTWAKDTLLEDTIPSDLEYVSSSGNGTFTGSKVTWNLGKLSPGNLGSVTIRAKVRGFASVGSTITNFADISTATNEPNKQNNRSSASFTVIDETSSSGNGNPPLGSSQNQEGQWGTSSSGCSEQKPDTPTNLIAIPGKSAGQVALSWTNPNSSYTYFLIAYSDNPLSPKWGNPNIGITNQFTVEQLGRGTYYFWVRAGNNCMPGSFAGPVKVALSRGLGRGVAQGFYQGVLGKATIKVSNQNNVEINKLESATPTPEKVSQEDNGNLIQKIFKWVKSHSPFNR